MAYSTVITAVVLRSEPCLNIKTVFTGMEISMIKIKWLWEAHIQILLAHILFVIWPIILKHFAASLSCSVQNLSLIQWLNLDMVLFENSISYLAPSHFLNQHWVIAHWTPRNKLQWNCYQNTKLFIHENAFENIVCEMTAILSSGRWVRMACGIPWHFSKLYEWRPFWKGIKFNYLLPLFQTHLVLMVKTCYHIAVLFP